MVFGGIKVYRLRRRGCTAADLLIKPVSGALTRWSAELRRAMPAFADSAGTCGGNSRYLAPCARRWYPREAAHVVIQWRAICFVCAATLKPAGLPLVAAMSSAALLKSTDDDPFQQRIAEPDYLRRRADEHRSVNHQQQDACVCWRRLIRMQNWTATDDGLPGWLLKATGAMAKWLLLMKSPNPVF